MIPKGTRVARVSRTELVRDTLHSHSARTFRSV
jgi:hypothetical protein